MLAVTVEVAVINPHRVCACMCSEKVFVCVVAGNMGKRTGGGGRRRQDRSRSPFRQES